MVRQSSAAERRRQAVCTRRREAIAVYLASEDVESKQIQTMLQLVDLYGLLYPVKPQEGLTARAIHRQADAAGRTQYKKTWHALKNVALDRRQTECEMAAAGARRKTLAHLYQRVRGPAVIPRYPTAEARVSGSLGRRPELELTRFVQVGVRYLNHQSELSPDHAEECLAGVQLRAEGTLRPSKAQVRKMKDCIHTRLMSAPVLQDFDYCIAIGQDPGKEWMPVVLKYECPPMGGNMQLAAILENEHGR